MIGQTCEWAAARDARKTGGHRKSPPLRAPFGYHQESISHHLYGSDTSSARRLSSTSVSLYDLHPLYEVPSSETFTAQPKAPAVACRSPQRRGACSATGAFAGLSAAAMPCCCGGAAADGWGAVLSAARRRRPSGVARSLGPCVGAGSGAQ